MSRSRKTDLRIYHFATTLLALGIALWALYWAGVIAHTTKQNYRETQCNQGLLILATHDIWSEARLSKCSPEIKKALEAKYK